MSKTLKYSGMYNGLELRVYQVAIDLFKPWYCGYVKLTECLDEAFIEDIACHGGITFVGEMPGEDGIWIGFDTAHPFIGPPDNIAVEFCINEAKGIIDQVLENQNKE